MKRFVVAVGAVLLGSSVALAQEAKDAKAAQGGPPRIEQSKIDAAINKGVAWLKSRAAVDMGKRDHVNRVMQEDELVLWTFVHAGVRENDPVFEKLFKGMMERKLEATYCVSLQAMILEEVQRVKYQWRIKQCAQFLVDNHATNGQWTYGEPTIYAEETPTDTGKPDVASSGDRKPGAIREFLMPGERHKPEVRNRTKVTKQKPGPGGGDNSNTQYAALGMRACHDGGIILPDEVIEKSIAWYRSCQKATDGPRQKFDVKDNLDNIFTPPGASGVMDRIDAEPQGWCYRDHADHPAYGSMTAGSVGGLAIWLYIKDNDGGKKKRSWRKDKDVQEGLAWLSHFFSVTYNPGPYEHGNMEKDSQHQYEYYLYALERAGMLYGTETIGTHWWYPEGAKVLIEKQKAEGTWGSGVVDTCFAILFLKRATSPLTPSVSAR